MPFVFNPVTGKLDFVNPPTTDASLLTSGTLADARLSSNVSLNNINNNFSAAQSITAAANTSALTASYSVTGANTTPLLNLTGTWNTTGIANGIRLNITDTASAATSLLADLQVGGVSRFNIDKAGHAYFGVSASASDPIIRAAATPNASSSGICYINTGWLFNAGGAICGNISSGGMQAGQFGLAASIGGSSDVILTRDAANTLALRNGTNAQAFRLYNTFTDASNFERAFMRWNSNTLQIGTEAGGTGAARDISIINSSSGPIRLFTSTTTQCASFQYGDSFIAGPFSIRNNSFESATLTTESANVLSLRSGTAAQTFNIFGTRTSASVFERLRIAATSTRNQIISESTGGTVRPLEMSFFSSASDPATTDITSGAFGVWKNTGSGVVKLWVNDGGTMKSVSLS